MAENKTLLLLARSKRAAFRTREFAASYKNKAYARLVLHRLKKQGKIKSVKKGWWAFPDAMPEAVACEISRPAYLSFHSALYLHRLTTQFPRWIQLAVSRPARKYALEGTEAKEYRIRPGSFRDFSVKDGMLLATPEKAFSDCLNVPRACPQIVLAEALPGIDTEQVKKQITRPAARRLKELMQRAEQG